MGNSSSNKRAPSGSENNSSNHLRIPSIYKPTESLIKPNIFSNQRQINPKPFVRNLDSQKPRKYQLDYARTATTFPIRANPAAASQNSVALPTVPSPFLKDRYGPLSLRSSLPVGFGPPCNVLKNLPALPSSQEQVEKTVERGRNSWSSWLKDYTSSITNGPKGSLLDRISTNVDKYAQEIHETRLKRLVETNNHFINKESSRIPPSLNSYVPIDSTLSSYRKNDEKYFSLEPKRPELTFGMLDRIQEVSKPQPSNEVLVELDGVQILRKDIQTLLGLNWLNDEIINAYMNLLVIRGKQHGRKKVYAFNTFFYPKLRETGYNSVRRWTRKVDVFSHDYIIVPVHLGNHWCLGFIDFPRREISYYDSLGGYSNGCCDTLLDYLRDESNDKKKQDFDDENWRLVDKYNEGIPQQRNCSDCGVFACTYAEYLTRQAKLTFTQEHMPYFRKKMIYEIITKSILE